MAKRIKVKDSLNIGDKVENVIKATKADKLVSIFTNSKDCGCKERKTKLNNLGRYLSSRCMTEDEYNDWSVFVDNRTLDISDSEIIQISKLYSSLFDKPYYRIENNNFKPLLRMIDLIDKVYNVYKEDINGGV